MLATKTRFKIVVVLAIVIGIITVFHDNIYSWHVNNETRIAAIEKQEQKDQLIKQLQDLGISQDISQNILDSLNSVGLNHIIKFSQSNHTGILIATDEIYGQVSFNIIENKVGDIMTPEQSFLMIAGQKKSDIKDVYISDDTKYSFIDLAQTAVRSQLKAPSSANFSNDKLRYDGDNLIITGNVDAVNSYGVKLRNSYIVTINKSTSKVLNVEIL